MSSLENEITSLHDQVDHFNRTYHLDQDNDDGVMIVFEQTDYDDNVRHIKKEDVPNIIKFLQQYLKEYPLV